MIREYLKLSRSFNAILTGISPVMGAIAMKQYDLFTIFILFIIGLFGHTFGFVLNDIIDYKIDKSSKEISDRPLISRTISLRNAWIFALISLTISFLLALYLAYPTGYFVPVIILVVSAFFIMLYNLISKKFPFMDIFVSLGIFFFILYGATTQVTNISDISLLVWIVCIIGSIKALFLQIVLGGLKDIENDYIKGAKTTAIRLGVRMKDSQLKISNTFKKFAYLIQIIDIIIVFISFYLIKELLTSFYINVFQWIILIIISLLMLILSHKLLSMSKFDRKNARKLIGSHYIVNFMPVPIMLMSLNPWIGLLMFFPGIGFILSNIILHKTILQPKTM
jgi:4-hydroxybenzoate polyprenyltransferase